MPPRTRLETALLRDTQLSRDEVFDLARQDRYTGVIAFHTRDGVPVKVEAGRALQGNLKGDADREDLTQV